MKKQLVAICQTYRTAAVSVFRNVVAICQTKPTAVIGVCGLLLLWTLIGFIPLMLKGDGLQAGVFGDSFGFVNSLFSGFAFLIATYALIMQIQESHESAKIQRDQTELQESMRRDGVRNVAMTTFLKISTDLHRYYRAWGQTHRERLEKTRQRDPGRVDEIYGEYREALDQLKSNKLAIDLLFSSSGDPLQKAIDNFAETAQEPIQTGRADGADELEFILFGKIEKIEQLMRPLWDSIDEPQA